MSRRKDGSVSSVLYRALMSGNVNSNVKVPEPIQEKSPTEVPNENSNKKKSYKQKQDEKAEKVRKQEEERRKMASLEMIQGENARLRDQVNLAQSELMTMQSISQTIMKEKEEILKAKEFLEKQLN